LKLGFVFDEKSNTWAKGYFTLKPLLFAPHLFECKTFNIQFIHQLQMLCNLAGVELTKQTHGNCTQNIG